MAIGARAPPRAAALTKDRTKQGKQYTEHT